MKDLDQFYKRSDGSRRPWCMDCCKEYAVNYNYAANLVAKAKEIHQKYGRPLTTEDEFDLPPPLQLLIPKEEAEFPPGGVQLDWLTPLWAFDTRPVVAQNGTEDDPQTSSN